MQVEKILPVLLVALAGCGPTRFTDVYSCENPDKGHKDVNGEPDPCHYNDVVDAGHAADAGDAGDAADAGDEDDAGDAEPPDAAGETCPGICVPGLPGGWFGPSLFWMGAEAAAPSCADVPGLPLEFFTGHADLDGPLCGACTCEQPSGSCALPATLTAAAASCAGDSSSVEHTPFGPPPKWEGDCTAANAISAGKLCGGVPCVQSVTIAPLTLKQGGCLPIEPPKAPPPNWTTFTRACSPASVLANCGQKGGVCMPIVADSKFRICAMQKGAPNQVACPPAYPDKRVFYGNSADTLACSPCSCGAPAGSTCTGSVSIFPDSGCGAPLVVSVSIDATGPLCTDIKPAGSGLGSMSASEPIFTPGACKATGGELAAGSSPLVSTVVCCQGMP